MILVISFSKIFFIKYLKLIFMKISDCAIFLIHENIMLHISQGKKDAHFML